MQLHLGFFQCSADLPNIGENTHNRRGWHGIGRPRAYCSLWVRALIVVAVGARRQRRPDIDSVGATSARHRLGPAVVNNGCCPRISEQVSDQRQNVAINQVVLARSACVQGYRT